MGPDWKRFVEEVIKEIENGKSNWGKKELVTFIKDKEIQFLEKELKRFGLLGEGTSS